MLIAPPVFAEFFLKLDSTIVAEAPSLMTKIAPA